MTPIRRRSHPVVLAAVAALLVAVLGVGASPVAAGPATDRLAATLPREIDGQPLEITPVESDTWLENELGADASGPEAGAVRSAIDEAGGFDALGVVQAFAMRGDEEFLSVEGIALDALTGQAVLDLVAPALLVPWGEVATAQEEIGGVPVLAIRLDPTAENPDAVLFATDDVAWYLSGSGALLTAGVTTLANAAALPEPTPTPAPASALEAILRDAADGTIDATAALRYRYLAAFSEVGLPDVYASLPPAEDATLIAELIAAAPTLPPELLDAVAPIIVRPDDPRSLLFGEPAEVGAGGSVRALALGRAEVAGAGPRVAQADCTAGGWTSRAAPSAPVRVWSRCDSDGEGVSETLAMVGDLWGPMTALMGAPIPDAGGRSEGGDTSIDLYLVQGCDPSLARFVCLDGGDLAATRPSHPLSGGAAGTASGYVVLDRATMATASPEARAQVAHELMHVLQLGHAFTARIHGASWHWFGEATAVWAEHHFVPESRRIRADGWLETFQNRPFGLTSPTGLDPYSAWTWPLFMEQEAGAAAIGAAWSAMEGATDWEHLDQAVDSAVSFGTRFKDFAVRAWNRVLPRTGGGEAIAPRFQALDAGLPLVPPGDARWSRTDAGAMGAPDAPLTFDERIPALGVRYRELTLMPAVRRLVIDGNGLQGGDDLDIEALVHVRSTGWERRTLQDGETTFCRDLPPDDLDRIILVLANHHTRHEVAGQLEVRPLAEPCDLWDATMTETVRWNQGGLKGEARATFTGRWQPVDDGVSYCSGACVAYVPTGTVDWTWNSSRKDMPCSASTSGSLATGDVVVPTDQMLFLDPDGDVVRYWGSGTIFPPEQPCFGWEGMTVPDGFFLIYPADDPIEEGPAAARPSCSSPFSFPAGSEVVQGTCWIYDEPGYEDRVEWRMVKVGSTSAPD